MKKHVYERIGRLMDQISQLEDQLDQVTGGQVYRRLTDLESVVKNLTEKLQEEQLSYHILAQEKEELEDENRSLQRKADRFNAIKDELELVQHINTNLDSQLEAARQEIDQLKKNQPNSYLSVV